MGINWVADIADMHRKYGVKDAIATFDKEKLEKFLEFRIKFLQEELDELKEAKNADDVVDALIDLCVVAIGTLDAYNVNSFAAWDRVHEANMNKEIGIKASRPNPLGLPDLIKPEGWEAPFHFDNVGYLANVFDGVQELQREVAATVTEIVMEAVNSDANSTVADTVETEQAAIVEEAVTEAPKKRTKKSDEGDK